MSTGDISIATSIAPGARLDVQQVAVASWLDQGFSVLSLNAMEEIGNLERHFPGVDFVPASRTAKPFIGKPLVFVNDLLDALGRRSEPIVGIVNSDIRIDARAGLADFIARHSSDGLLFGPRLDVRSWDDPDGRQDPFGFDLFFFPRVMAGIWPPTRFCLGQGYWDFWMPLTAILQNKPARKIVPPVARHIVHETRRNEAFFLFADAFARVVSEYMGDSTFGEGFAPDAYVRLREALESTPENQHMRAMEEFARYIDALTRYVIRFIDSNAEMIAPPAADARARSSGVPISMNGKSPT